MIFYLWFQRSTVTKKTSNYTLYNAVCTQPNILRFFVCALIYIYIIEQILSISTLIFYHKTLVSFFKLVCVCTHTHTHILLNTCFSMCIILLYIYIYVLSLPAIYIHAVCSHMIVVYLLLFTVWKKYIWIIN